MELEVGQKRKPTGRASKAEVSIINHGLTRCLRGWFGPENATLGRGRPFRASSERVHPIWERCRASLKSFLASSEPIQASWDSFTPSPAAFRGSPEPRLPATDTAFDQPLTEQADASGRSVRPFIELSKSELTLSQRQIADAFSHAADRARALD